MVLDMPAIRAGSMRSLKAATAFANAAQALYAAALCDLKQAKKEAATVRISMALEAIDLFGPEPNHEDYVPGEK